MLYVYLRSYAHKYAITMQSTKNYNVKTMVKKNLLRRSSQHIPQAVALGHLYRPIKVSSTIQNGRFVFRIIYYIDRRFISPLPSALPYAPQNMRLYISS